MYNNVNILGKLMYNNCITTTIIVIAHIYYLKPFKRLALPNLLLKVIAVFPYALYLLTAKGKPKPQSKIFGGKFCFGTIKK